MSRIVASKQKSHWTNRKEEKIDTNATGYMVGTAGSEAHALPQWLLKKVACPNP